MGAEPIRGIVRGYIFEETRQDLRYILDLIRTHQLSPSRALEMIEQYVICGRELPRWLPEVEEELPLQGEN